MAQKLYKAICEGFVKILQRKEFEVCFVFDEDTYSTPPSGYKKLTCAAMEAASNFNKSEALDCDLVVEHITEIKTIEDIPEDWREGIPFGDEALLESGTTTSDIVGHPETIVRNGRTYKLVE